MEALAHAACALARSSWTGSGAPTWRGSTRWRGGWRRTRRCAWRGATTSSPQGSRWSRTRKRWVCLGQKGENRGSEGGGRRVQNGWAWRDYIKSSRPDEMVKGEEKVRMRRPLLHTSPSPLSPPPPLPAASPPPLPSAPPRAFWTSPRRPDAPSQHARAAPGPSAAPPRLTATLRVLDKETVESSPPYPTAPRLLLLPPRRRDACSGQGDGGEPAGLQVAARRHPRAELPQVSRRRHSHWADWAGPVGPCGGTLARACRLRFAVPVCRARAVAGGEASGAGRHVEPRGGG